MFLWGSDDDVQMMPAHRLAYELYRGDIGDLLALHKCIGKTNKTLGRCVNANHIKMGTAAENWRDMIRDGTAPGPPLSEEQVLQCFLDRKTLTVAERAAKYDAPESWVVRLDEGWMCRDLTGLVRPEPSKRRGPYQKRPKRKLKEVDV